MLRTKLDSYTIEEILKIDEIAKWLTPFTSKGLDRLCRGKLKVTALDILSWDLPANTCLHIVLHEPLLPLYILQQFMCEVALDVLDPHRLMPDVPLVSLIRKKQDMVRPGALIEDFYQTELVSIKAMLDDILNDPERPVYPSELPARDMLCSARTGCGLAYMVLYGCTDVTPYDIALAVATVIAGAGPKSITAVQEGQIRTLRNLIIEGPRRQQQAYDLRTEYKSKFTPEPPLIVNIDVGKHEQTCFTRLAKKRESVFCNTFDLLYAPKSPSTAVVVGEGEIFISPHRLHCDLDPNTGNKED